MSFLLFGADSALQVHSRLVLLLAGVRVVLVHDAVAIAFHGVDFFLFKGMWRHQKITRLMLLLLPLLEDLFLYVLDVRLLSWCVYLHAFLTRDLSDLFTPLACRDLKGALSALFGKCVQTINCMLGLLGDLAGLVLGSSFRVPPVVWGRISHRSLCLCTLNLEWLREDSRVLLGGALLHLLL